MNQLEQLNQIVADLDLELNQINDLQALQQKKALYLGKKGPLAAVMASMREIGRASCRERV